MKHSTAPLYFERRLFCRVLDMVDFGDILSLVHSDESNSSIASVWVKVVKAVFVKRKDCSSLRVVAQ